MALSNDPVFAQTPKTAGISFGAGTQSTAMDPATVAPTVLLTAGADGALVTSIQAFAEVTVTAEKFVLWIQHGGTGDWLPIKEKLMAAYTMAVTTAQTPVTFVDRLDPNAAIRLQGTDKLGVTHHVDQQSMVVAEYTDF